MLKIVIMEFRVKNIIPFTQLDVSYDLQIFSIKKSVLVRLEFFFCIL